MTVFVAGRAATWAMVGLIWLVQLVHYPMLVGWSTADPVAAAAFHQRRMLVQVPLHSRLAAGSDPEAADRLCSTNWIRTGAWTLRGFLLAAVLIT